MAGKLLWTGTVSFAVDFYSFYPLYPAGELTYVCILMWMDLLPQTNKPKRLAQAVRGRECQWSWAIGGF